jgi:putative membrane protein
MIIETQDHADNLMTPITFVRWIVAALHLLGLGLGLGAIWARSRAFRDISDTKNIQRALYADTLWGIAALVWNSTGLARAFAGLEKGSAYYLANDAFWVKLILLGLVLLLEICPMVTLIRWRIQLARRETVDTRLASRFAWASVVQTLLVPAIVFAATAMARGLGV